MDAGLDFDFTGSRAAVTRIETSYLEAEKRAVREVTREAEQALEAATAGAGLGRLSRAWSSAVYPKSGRAKNPVGYIYPKGGKRTEGAIRSFTRGARIRALSGGFTAFPTEAAGKAPRGQEMTPAYWEAKNGQTLRPVFRPGKAPLLVADGRVNARGRFKARFKRDARRVGPGYGATVIIFVLMPEFSLQSRFSIEQTLSPFPGRLASRFLQYANAGD
jgi:hypothetical protein